MRPRSISRKGSSSIRIMPVCLFNLGFIAERQGDARQAENYFQQTLRSNPDFPDALLELANLRMAAKKFAEAEELLRRYVRVSRDPANGYYKLAMAERSLHETAAADRDLNSSRPCQRMPRPDRFLSSTCSTISTIARRLRPARATNWTWRSSLNEVKNHPDQPENLYLLAEAYLKAGKWKDAKTTIAQLDQLSAGDFRTLAGIGVLLARFHLYDDAIQHFQQARKSTPTRTT